MFRLLSLKLGVVPNERRNALAETTRLRPVIVLGAIIDGQHRNAFDLKTVSGRGSSPTGSYSTPNLSIRMPQE